MAAVLYLRLRSDPEPVKLEDPGDGESEVRLYAVDAADAADGNTETDKLIHADWPSRPKARSRRGLVS